MHRFTQVVAHSCIQLPSTICVYEKLYTALGASGHQNTLVCLRSLGECTNQDWQLAVLSSTFDDRWSLYVSMTPVHNF